MSEDKHLIIGTRGSKLALIQTALVSDALKHHYSELIIETKIIKTEGDINQSPIPLDTIGKSWFTAEIEQALTNGEIDLAIHSLKDMSLQIPFGLTTTAVLERADPRDVLISKSAKHLADLPAGAIIGTDSVRRKVLLLNKHPNLIVKSIRGNVDTRIKKLHSENYDAIVIAAAGLERLGMLDVVTEFFDQTTFLPASGQGILAAQTRSDRNDILELLHNIEHVPTQIAAQAELTFSRAMGGGCKLPIGCFAQVKENTISIHAVVGDLNSNKVLRKSIDGSLSEAVHLAEELAKKFL